MIAILASYITSLRTSIFELKAKGTNIGLSQHDFLNCSRENFKELLRIEAGFFKRQILSKVPP